MEALFLEGEIQICRTPVHTQRMSYRRHQCSKYHKQSSTQKVELVPRRYGSTTFLRPQTKSRDPTKLEDIRHSPGPVPNLAPLERESSRDRQQVSCDQDIEWQSHRRGLWKRSLSILVDSTHHIDPFYRCSRAGNASSFNIAVEYYWHNYHLNYSQWYPIFGVEAVNSHMAFALMEQETFMHVWLGFVHLNKAVFAPESSSSVDSSRHIGIGMSRVRQMIMRQGETAFQDTARDCLVGSIFFLALIARLQGDSTASALHHRHLVKLIASQGGSESLGCEGHLTAAILHNECLDNLDSAVTDFPAHYSSLHPVLQDSFTTELWEQVRGLPYGFQHLVKLERFPVDLVRLLIRIKIAHEVERSEARDSFYTGPCSYRGFSEACSSLRTPGPNFRKFFCLTLLLHVQIQFAANQKILPLQATFNSPRRLLTKQIHLLRRMIHSKASRECWMWMWMVLIGSWVDRTGTGGLGQTGRSLLVEFRHQFPELRVWNDISTVLGKFFDPPSFRETFKSYWESEES